MHVHVRVCVSLCVCVCACKHVERIFLSFAFWFILSVKQLPVETVWVGREEERWRRWRWRRGGEGEEEWSDKNEEAEVRQGGKSRGREGEKAEQYVVWREERRREGELLVTHQGLETKKPRTLPPLLPPSFHPSQTQTFSSHRKRVSWMLQQPDRLWVCVCVLGWGPGWFG